MSRFHDSSFALRRTSSSRLRSAFTLIEMLLVLVIIVVLATMIVPRLVGRAQDSKKSAAKGDISNIKSSLSIFENDNGRFPTTSEGLDALVHEPSGLDTWKGPYVEGTPKDPWGNAYHYACPGNHGTDYDLYSSGPNGQDDGGAGDDIVNWATDK